MVEHWYEYLPACWLMPEGRWYVIGSILLLMLLSFLAGWFCARRTHRSTCLTSESR